ncbi:MAG TPA: hypothetical protein DCZ94_18990 [Lentisphaeria bacterium]|nr:hypothetical protein [Lentisphaeria bacterium]
MRHLHYRRQEKSNGRGIDQCTILTGDIFNLRYVHNSFDLTFTCFVLEHFPRPAEVLKILKNHLRSSGTITVIEGDHVSVFFYPRSEAAHRKIQHLLQ